MNAFESTSGGEGLVYDWDGMYTGNAQDTMPMDVALLADALTEPPGRALDLGCGAGGNAIGLAKRGWTVVGIDGAPKAIQAARTSAALAGVTVTWEVADLTTYWPEPTFDLVLSSYALPVQGADRDRAFTVAKQALAPGGLLLVLEWDADHMDWGARRDFVTLDEVSTALSGLRIERLESIPTAPHVHHDHGDPSHVPHAPARPQHTVIAAARRHG